MNIYQSLASITSRFHIAVFRPLQREAIESALVGHNSLVVMPTGAGKSLCYQGPATLLRGTTVVISPLISLMEDQVDKLNRRGIPAAFINSSISVADQQEIEEQFKRGDYDLVYVSPERVTTPAFMTLLAACKVTAFVIDEAHCIAQWGHDFRPDYARLGNLRKCFPAVPIQAYTATATPRVRDEIVASLSLRQPDVFVGDFDRPNLVLRVEQRMDLDRQLLDPIRAHQDEAGIIYCMRRKDTEAVAGYLQLNGISALAYHAGLDPRERRAVQSDFMNFRVDVVVATVAFGMGIDRPDVRYVLHAQMPSSIEQYHQEIGRAGRDGQPADCVIFHDENDYDTWLSLLSNHDGPRDDVTNIGPVEEALELIELYCTLPPDPQWTSCRHWALCDHFGQQITTTCQACDNCMSLHGEARQLEVAC